jgi:hypothetical protein
LGTTCGSATAPSSCRVSGLDMARWWPPARW